MKKILIITAEKTGFGHKSSSNAIEKKLNEAGFECRQIDLFPRMGWLGRLMEGSYIPLTTRAPFVYFICQRFSQAFPGFIHTSIYLLAKKTLLENIGEFAPDAIISVHCMFTKAISRLICRRQLGIPFYVGVIDLVDPPKVWEDKRADMSFVPTDTIREDYLRKGFQSERVTVSGFPVRDDITVRSTPKPLTDPLQILMVNPSTDLQKNIAFVQEVSRLENVRIRFVCGLDERLHDTLLQMQADGQLPETVELYGYIRDMNRHMNECQIVMTKAGPNAMVESVRSGAAVVVTGHIEGQENRNHEFIVNNGYGIRCEDPDRIYDTLRGLIESGQLQRCLEQTISRPIGNGAEIIADYVREHI